VWTVPLNITDDNDNNNIQNLYSTIYNIQEDYSKVLSKVDNIDVEDLH